MNQEIEINNYDSLQRALSFLSNIVPDKNRPIIIIIREGTKRPRSDLMNRCMHKYFEKLAEALNDAGYDFKKFLEVSQYKLDVPWNKYLCKDTLWRPVQIAMTGKESTTAATDGECCQIYDVVNARVAELTGVSVEWPHD